MANIKHRNKFIDNFYSSLVVLEWKPEEHIFYHSDIYQSYRLSFRTQPNIFINASDYEGVYADDAFLLNEFIHKVTEGERHAVILVRLETRDSRSWKGGQYRWSRIAAESVYNAKGSLVRVVCTIMDIEDILNEQTELCSVKEKLDSIVSNIPLGVAIYSFRSDGDLILKFMNNKAIEIYGITEEMYREYCLGKSIGELIPELKDYQIAEADLKKLSADQALSFTEQLSSLHSGKKWLQFNCVIRGKGEDRLCYVVFQDVDEKIHRENRQKWQDERYRLLAESSGAVNFDYDVKEDRLTVFDPSGKTGRHETIVEHAARLTDNSYFTVREKDLLLFRQHYRLAAARHSEGCFEYQLKTEKHDFQWYSLKYVSVENQSGQVIRIVGLTECIQKQKEQEQNICLSCRDAFHAAVNADTVLSMGFDLETGERIREDHDRIPNGFSGNLKLSALLMQILVQIHPDDKQKIYPFNTTEKLAKRIDNRKKTTGQRSGKFWCEARLGFVKADHPGYRWTRIEFLYAMNRSTGHINLFVMMTDIEDQKAGELSLIEKSRIDPATEMLNKQSFYQDVRKTSCYIGADDVWCFAVIYFKSLSDIDRIMDDDVDEILKKAALTVRVSIKSGELCGRLGDAMFGIFINGRGNKRAVQERLRILKAALVSRTAGGTVITPEIGAEIVTLDSPDFKTIRKRAVMALKALGRRQVHDIAYYTEHLAGPTGLSTSKNSTVYWKKNGSSSEATVQNNPEKRIFIRTFGYFDVFINGQSVLFKFSKAKELLALLVDRRGGYVTSAEAIGCLWENEEANKLTLSRYRKVAMQLKQILEENDILDIIEIHRGTRRVNTSRFDCDLYNYLAGKTDFENQYRGAYMSHYKWGKLTTRALNEMEQRKNQI